MNEQVEEKQNIEEMRHIIVILARQFGILQKESSQCCGITAVQSHILYEIKNAYHLSLNELSEKLGLDNSTTSRHVQGLVEKALVERHPDPNDRRYVTLGLTEKGMVLEQEISDFMTACIIDIFKQLPAGKVSNVTSGLKLLTQAMCKSDSCCKPPL